MYLIVLDYTNGVVDIMSMHAFKDEEDDTELIKFLNEKYSNCVFTYMVGDSININL